MGYHLKETKDVHKSVAYEPSLCGISDYGQLRYAMFNPEDGEKMSRMRNRLAADSSGLCRACYAVFLSRLPSEASDEPIHAQPEQDEIDEQEREIDEMERLNSKFGLPLD